MQLIQMNILLDKKEAGTVMSFTAKVKSFEISGRPIHDISIKLDLIDGSISFSSVEKDFEQKPIDRCKVLSPKVCILYSGIHSFIIQEQAETGLAIIDIKLIGCSIFGKLEDAESYLVAKELMK